MKEKYNAQFDNFDKLKTDIFGIRLKITHDGQGNDWNYIKIIIPLKIEQRKMA